MNAAVLHQLGSVPKYETFPEPQPQNSNQLVLKVSAVSIKNLDKARVAGTHYSNYSDFPVVVGMDAVGQLENGQWVFAQGITGTLAEKTLVDKNKLIELPEGINPEKASALPNALIGAALALKFRAAIKPGETVLVNGATGVTGQMAVQLAKYYGAKTVIATGRSEEALRELKNLGADFTISLNQDAEKFIEELQKNQQQNPVDIVIDYLWGEPLENIIQSLPKGGIGKASYPVKIVTVGDMAGKTITLPSGILRSSDILILGSGYGSLSPDDFALFEKELLPEMFQLLADGKISISIETYPLSEIEAVWHKKIPSGKRLVITMNNE